MQRSITTFAQLTKKPTAAIPVINAGIQVHVLAIVATCIHEQGKVSYPLITFRCFRCEQRASSPLVGFHATQVCSPSHHLLIQVLLVLDVNTVPTFPELQSNDGLALSKAGAIVRTPCGI